MDPVEMASRHRKLIDAIKSRDPERVGHAMREHIESVGKPIVDTLEEEDQQE